MVFKTGAIILLILVGCGTGFALEPDEILVIANKDIAISERIARYYCKKRGVPDENILSLSLGISLNDTIGRDDYEKRIAEPIRKELSTRNPLGKTGPKPIRCLLMIYGVPIKVGRRGTLTALEGRLKELRELVKQEKERIEQTAPGSKKQSSAEQKKSNQNKRRCISDGSNEKI